MHVDACNRKRRRTPKTRTGCTECKKAHTKCCETKPVCRRCERSDRKCQYDSVKTWVFDPGSNSPPSRALKTLEQPSRALQWQWLPVEDRHALGHYFRHTGPWIANYAPPSVRGTWEVTLPRCAHALPATLHALVAVAILDQPVPHPDTSRVAARSRRVLHHYNLAIQALTQSRASLSPLDTVLASVLLWLLETLGFNSPLAKMHYSAASGTAQQQLDPRLRKLAQSDANSESSGIMSIDVPALLAFCDNYIATTPAAGNRYTPDESDTEHAENPVLAAMLLRQGPCPIESAEEFRDAWVLYFTKLRPTLPNGMSALEAEEYIAYWKVACVRYRYVMKVHASIVLLGYLVAGLARSLLPISDDHPSPDWTVIEGAVDFILARATDMVSMKMPPDQKLLQEELLSLVATTVLRYSPNENHHAVASQVLAGCERRPDFYAMSQDLLTPENSTSSPVLV